MSTSWILRPPRPRLVFGDKFVGKIITLQLRISSPFCPGSQGNCQRLLYQEVGSRLAFMFGHVFQSYGVGIMVDRPRLALDYLV